MMKTLLLKTHYTVQEAYSLLMLLDELRDALWQNYHEEIIEYQQQQEEEYTEMPLDIEEDEIPF